MTRATLYSLSYSENLLLQSLMGQARQLLDSDYASHGMILQEVAQQCRFTLQTMRKVNLAFITRVSDANFSRSQSHSMLRSDPGLSRASRSDSGPMSDKGSEASTRPGNIPAKPKVPTSRHIVWRYPSDVAEGGLEVPLRREDPAGAPAPKRRYRLGDEGYARPPSERKSEPFTSDTQRLSSVKPLKGSSRFGFGEEEVSITTSTIKEKSSRSMDGSSRRLGGLFD